MAIILSAASLTWQALSWLWSGPKIRIEVRADQDVVTVTAYNSGRSAAAISSVRAWKDDKDEAAQDIRIDTTPLAQSDPIPHLVVAGGHGTWKFKALRWSGDPWYKDKKVSEPEFDWMLSSGGYGGYGGGLDRFKTLRIHANVRVEGGKYGQYVGAASHLTYDA